MTAALRLLDYGVVPYSFSQAVYHAVAEAMTEDAPDTLIVLAPDRPHFCTGFHQDPRRELDLVFCRRHGLPVLRRRVGGGTTYLDSNQLYYQLVVHHRRAPAMVDALYRFALEAPVQTLRALGLPAGLQSTNEVVVSGRRISGTGAGRIGEASIVVGNFLFDFDYAIMARGLRAPSEEFRRLARQGMKRHLTTLRRELPNPPSMDQVKAALVERYGESLRRAVEPGCLTARERELVREAEAELGSEEWLFEVEQPPRRRLKIAAGVWLVEAHCSIADGRAARTLRIGACLHERTVEALAIAPEDGSADGDWQRIAQSLTGVPLEADSLRWHISRCCARTGSAGAGDFEPLVQTLIAMGRD